MKATSEQCLSCEASLVCTVRLTIYVHECVECHRKEAEIDIKDCAKLLYCFANDKCPRFNAEEFSDAYKNTVRCEECMNEGRK